MDLAYLVIDRAPLRAEPFRALLILALDANDRDHCYMTLDKLAWMGRFTRARVQIMMAALEANEYIHRFRWGDPRNPAQGYLLVKRERLYRLPRRPMGTPNVQRPSTFNGEKRAVIDTRIAGSIVERARAAAEEIRVFHDLKPGQHHAYLGQKAKKNS